MSTEHGRLLCARRIAHDDRLCTQLASLLVEAACPYACALYGDRRTAAAVFAAAMPDDSCEVSLDRTQILMKGKKLVGCYVAMAGTELPGCRRAELLAALRQLGPGGAAALGKRLASLSTLFPPIGGDEFYLSKIAVCPEARGCGIGRLLVDHYLARGRGLGFRRFRLDVAEDNLAARRLYERAGFRAKEAPHRAEGAPSYLSMSAADEEISS